MTANELERELSKPFSLEIWQDLWPQLLPGLSLFSQTREIPLLSKSEQSVAESLRQLGTARLADGKGIGLFLIEAKESVELARNRVGLRQLSARWIDEGDIHAALTLSYQPGVGFYRLTYAARETIFTPDLQTSTRETATRRFTYVLGEGERHRTAAQRLALLADRRPELELQNVTDAFSVDRLNKEFFADFCRVRAVLTEELESRSGLSAIHARAEAQTILNRLLFLYFLQRKGWLNRQRDYLRAGFSEFSDKPEKSDFYTHFLAPVFSIVSTEWRQREKLTTHLEANNPHTHDLPFLNGGLFADELAAIHTDDTVRRRRGLKIRNTIFDEVFGDLFERYNFTIHEDSERDAEVAVDPEMLGRIFEELVLTGEESESGGKSRRHDTGSHYTPRPIVRYLCREALAEWLADRAPFAGKTDPRQTVDSLLAMDSTIGLDDDTWVKLRDLLTPMEAANALDSLDELRACDPAVGSGAFPLGLLHELLNTARLLDSRARGKDPGEHDEDWLYDTKKRLIERCLYGVDIQEEALEICKLRLWLSLMVDHQLGVDPDHCDRRAFAAALKKVEPLPNLEFKIRRANALIDMIRGHRLYIERPRPDASMRAVLTRLRDAKHQFYNADTAAKKRRFRFTIYEATAELAQHELSWLKRDLGLGLDDSPEVLSRLSEIQDAERALGEVRLELDAAKRFKATEQEDALERLRAWWENPKAPTFVWHFDFAEVFHRATPIKPAKELLPEESDTKAEAGSLAGFDLQLGNPPFIRIQVLKRDAPEDVGWYRKHYEAATKGNYDLYVVFVERALKLLHGHGQLAFICPHKFFNAQYGEPLRNLIARGRNLRHVVHFGDQQIFPGATNYVCLLFLARAGAETCRFVRADILPIWLAALRGVEGDVTGTRVTSSEWNFAVGKNAGLFERIGRMGDMLGNLADAFVGLQTSADDVFILELICEEVSGLRLRSRVLNREVLLERALLHPLVSGEDVKGFAPLPARQFILFPYRVANEHATLMPFDELHEAYRRCGDYLLENQQRLASREGGKFDDDEWHRFGRSQNLGIQERPKLCVPRLVAKLHAGIDLEGSRYLDNVDVGGVTWKSQFADYGLPYLAALLNSQVLGWFFPQISAPFRGGFHSANKQFISLLPVPQPTAEVNSAISEIVRWLLFVHGQPSVQAPNAEYPRDPELATWFERWLNALVYEVFFPDEFHNRGLKFLSLTEDFAPAPPAEEYRRRRYPGCLTHHS